MDCPINRGAKENLVGILFIPDLAESQCISHHLISFAAKLQCKIADVSVFRITYVAQYVAKGTRCGSAIQWSSPIATTL